MGRDHDLYASVRCHLDAFRFAVAQGFGAFDFAGGCTVCFVIIGTDADWREAGSFAQLAHLAPASCAFQSIYGCTADVKPLEVAGGAFYSYGFLNFLWMYGGAVGQVVNLELLSAVVGEADGQLAAVCADGGIAVGRVAAAAGTGDWDAVGVLAVAAQGRAGPIGKAGDCRGVLAAAGGVAAGPEPGNAVYGNAVQVGSVAELFQGHIVYGIFPESFVFYAGQPQVFFVFSCVGQLGNVIIIGVIVGVPLGQSCRGKAGSRMAERQIAACLFCRGRSRDFSFELSRELFHIDVLLFLYRGDGLGLYLKRRRFQRAQGSYDQNQYRKPDDCPAGNT